MQPQWRNNMIWTWPEIIIGCVIGALLGLLIVFPHAALITPCLIWLPLLFTTVGLFFQKQINIVCFMGGWGFGFSLAASIVLYNHILPISMDILLASFYMGIAVGGATLIVVSVNYIAKKLHIKQEDMTSSPENEIGV